MRMPAAKERNNDNNAPMLAAREDATLEFDEFPATKAGYRYKHQHIPAGRTTKKNSLLVPDGRDEPSEPVMVTTVIKGAETDVSVDGAGDGDGATDEEEFAAPDEPPAAVDNCAKPIEGGFERSTVYTFFYNI